jgi:hypothetical protein
LSFEPSPTHQRGYCNDHAHCLARHPSKCDLSSGLRNESKLCVAIRATHIESIPAGVDSHDNTRHPHFSLSHRYSWVHFERCENFLNANLQRVHFRAPVVHLALRKQILIRIFCNLARWIIRTTPRAWVGAFDYSSLSIFDRPFTSYLPSFCHLSFFFCSSFGSAVRCQILRPGTGIGRPPFNTSGSSPPVRKNCPSS